MDTNFVDVAAFGFDDYVQSYLRVIGRLEDFQREFGELGKVIDLSKYVEDEAEFQEEALFEAVARGPEGYRAFKNNIYEPGPECGRRPRATGIPEKHAARPASANTHTHGAPVVS